MNIRKSVFVILFFSLTFFNAYSSPTFQIIQTDSLNNNLADTSLTGLQHSRPAFGPFFYRQCLGNLGAAFRSENFWEEDILFYNLGIEQFQVYEFSEKMNDHLPEWKTFSELKYINGSKKEQNFSIKHFQKLAKEISFGLDFRIVHSDGFYNKQVSNLRNFNLYTAAHSRNDRYNLILNYLSNKIVSQENGGLANDTTFELAGSFDSKVAAVNFNDVKNQHKTKIFYLQHKYDFFSKDSLDSTNISRKQFYLKHVFKHDRRSVLFTADNFYNSFFDHAYYDTTKTYDSLFVKSFFNDLSINFDNFLRINKLLRGGKTLLYASVLNEYFNYFQQDLDTVLRNFSVKIGGAIDFGDSLGFNFFTQRNSNDNDKLTSDNNLGFYKVHCGIYSTSRDKRKRVNFSLEKEIRNPDFIYTYYNSNHFIWFNQFNPIDFSKAELSAETKFSKQSFRITANLYSVKDLTYFNEEALPEQYPERINVLDIDLFHSIRFGKFNLINDLKYQHADRKEIVRLPDFSSYTSFFYENDFFKKALYVQFGLDVRYCTLYFADTYMPATGQFYLQNKKEIGNYAYADVFANFRIKTFRFFVKLEHVNAGFTERLYYTVPHYPMPGRSLKFGLIWQFFD